VFGLWLSPLFFYGRFSCFDNLIEIAAEQGNSAVANGKWKCSVYFGFDFQIDTGGRVD